jgi:DNA polymerase-3 subunit alpha
MIPFVNLHNHTAYSFLDSLVRIPELVERAKELKQPALAITDHGHLFGVFEFYEHCTKNGIKPILGCEIYLVENLEQKGYWHLVLLAQNQQGWENLKRLVSESFILSKKKKARVPWELLVKYHEGLICSTACPAGPVAKEILAGNIDNARQLVKRLKDIFGSNLYLEIQTNDLEDQWVVNYWIARLSKEMKVPLLATSDTHFLRKEDKVTHDIFIRINRETEDPTDFYNGCWLKTGEEILEELDIDREQAEEAVANSVKIAESCNVSIQFGQNLMPDFPVPEGYTPETYLRELCYANMTKEGLLDKKDALDAELETINRLGFAGYFLIVADIIRWAREQGIKVGPGRGSAPGSWVTRFSGISTLNPDEHGLFFERFINPERVTWPDIDSDFDYERRNEVLEYVVKKYGHDRVAQIATFGTLGTKAVLKDVGRALNIPFATMNEITKLVPDHAKSLNEALEQSTPLKKYAQRYPELFEHAVRIEGLPRHYSVHAAGVVVAPDELVKFVPLAVSNDVVIVQADMGTLEKLGLLKIDLLGLKTLTVIERCLENIRQSGQEPPDLAHIGRNDPRVYNTITTSGTAVFQLESSGIQEMFKQMKPTRFADIKAGLALYRPGPLGSGMVQDYNRRKNGEEPVEYLHPDLEPILAETYGVLIYQEQVMLIARKFAGYTLGEADLLRRAMGKKKPEEMAKHREKFISGCLANGYNQELAEQLFELMAKFAEYGFNAAHSAAYADLTYQTAFLKTYYPAEYMAAALSVYAGDKETVRLYINECKSLGLEILLPDINYSLAYFTVERGKIRWGLASIKHVGIQAVKQILANRPYESFDDFLARAGSRATQKQVVESLIKAGCFDFTGQDRKFLLERFAFWREKKTMEALSFEVRQQDKVFLDNCRFEREVLGVSLNHPMSQVKIPPWDKHPRIAIIGGYIVQIKEVLTRKKEEMAFITVETPDQMREVVVFPRLFAEKRSLLQEDNLILVKGNKDGEKLLAEEISLLSRG